MIDWLTLSIPMGDLNPETFDVFHVQSATICKIDSDGVIEWEKVARESIRSDSHQLTITCGVDLVITGSPARLVTGNSDNVFGSTDVRHCAQLMLDHIAKAKGVRMPPVFQFKCTRIDVTFNYYLGLLASVKQSLETMRHAEGGRYQVQTSAETVYWSSNSSYRKGKAYAKGPHLRKLNSKHGLNLTDEYLDASDCLLRLELTLASAYFRKLSSKKWFDLTETDLINEHRTYFRNFIGTMKVNINCDLEQVLIDSAIELGFSEGLGKSAYGTWCFVRECGLKIVQARMSRTTFFRHKKIMLNAGLSYSDFQARNIVPIRQKEITIDEPVNNWFELLELHKQAA